MSRTIAREVLVAILFAIAGSLMSATVASAAVKLPHSRTKDAIEGWCNEKGGTFYTWSDGSYHCRLPDGTDVDCLQGVCHIRVPQPTDFVVQLSAILSAEQDLLAKSGEIKQGQDRLADDIRAGQAQVLEQLRGLQPPPPAPDLVALPPLGTAGPQAFCRKAGKDQIPLIILVYNQGAGRAASSTTRVIFTTPQGPLAVDAVASPLAFGASDTIQIPMPASCSGAAAGQCDFAIVLDATGVLAESNKVNNYVSGSCPALRTDERQ